MQHSHSIESKPSPIFVTFARFLSLVISKILWRIRFINTENIPNNLETGLIVASNHQTYFDPFWISLSIKKDLYFMAWDEAFEWFLIGGLIRKLGAFPTSLKRGSTIKALKESLRILRNDKTLVVFPEGERAFADGKLLEFKTGAARLAIQSNVPILPVTVKNANKIWSRDHKLPRLGKVEIYYHPLIKPPQQSENEDLDKSVEILNNEVKEIISTKLN